jgi:hypothetical protein
MACAGLYHLVAIAVPAFRALAYAPGYPLWRHGVFVAVNATFAWLLLRRPIWLVGPFALLTVQIIQGHGVSAWRSWRDNGHIDWISVLTVAGALFGMALLLADLRARLARRP